jgi:asparagine synthase (glutamine-hydrolysing)
MCGILLVNDGSDKVLDSIKHRGIERTVIEKDGWFLCHHRLPIQTSDGDNWNQPKEVSPGVYLMFNGEIFNYDKSLYSSDIEYLCNLFGSYRSGSFEMFCALFIPRVQTWDGFWSIVLYDSNTGDTLAFTDPLGKKCLYYNDSGEISSEIKSLYASLSQIDKQFISSVRKWGYVTNNQTPFTDVKRFLPNTIYYYNINNPDFKQTYQNYYKGFNTPIEELVGMGYDEHMEWLWSKMFESVQNRLVSKNYPISLLISGGLDSSIIAAILAEMKADVKWFSIENGEKEYVDLLSKHLDKKVTFLDYSMDSGNLSEIYRIWNESPIDLGSVIPQYYLFEAVKKQSGYRIVLSGDGSDELFGGYSRINEYDSQWSDTFDELSFYHLPRLDKMSMAHTLELRSPFLHLDIVRFALHLPKEWRTNKKILKDTFAPLLPEEIVNRKKEALKNPEIKEDKLAYRQKAINIFLGSDN